MSFDIQWVLVVVGDQSLWQMKLFDGNIHKRMYNCKYIDVFIVFIFANITVHT